MIILMPNMGKKIQISIVGIWKIILQTGRRIKLLLENYMAVTPEQKTHALINVSKCGINNNNSVSPSVNWLYYDSRQGISINSIKKKRGDLSLYFTPRYLLNKWNEHLRGGAQVLVFHHMHTCSAKLWEAPAFHIWNRRPMAYGNVIYLCRHLPIIVTCCSHTFIDSK